jgi:hypothetical protein
MDHNGRQATPLKMRFTKAHIVALATALAWSGSAWLVTTFMENRSSRTALARLSEDAVRWAASSVSYSVLESAGFRLLLAALGFVTGWFAAGRRPGLPINLALLPIAACSAVMVQGYSPRATSLVMLPVALSVQLAAILSFTRWRWAAVGWCAFCVLSAMPIDVTTIDAPGKPRFVPLAMGLPTAEAFDAANRGELVLGGCETTGHEARWVWVW